MSEKLVAVGKVLSVGSPNNYGWVTVEVDVGSKYPLKLDTILEQIIAEADAARAWPAARVTYSEKESEKKNKYGKPYINRRLENIKQASSDDIKNFPARQTTSKNGTARTEQYESEAAREQHIIRQSVIKALIPAIFSTVISKTPESRSELLEEILSYAERIESWVIRKIPDEILSPVPSTGVMHKAWITITACKTANELTDAVGRIYQGRDVFDSTDQCIEAMRMVLRTDSPAARLTTEERDALRDRVDELSGIVVKEAEEAEKAESQKNNNSESRYDRVQREAKEVF